MKIENLSAGYHKKAVVKNLNIEIEKGEIISLIGPNGGGKSTLLKSITGELKAVGGAVYIGDSDIKKLPLKELSQRMSIVGTGRVTPQHMTAMDIVMSGRLPYSDGFGIFKESDRKAAEKAGQLMKIEELFEKPFENLSDGQKQRTLIARAICQEPEYLIMDEPTSYLDIRYRLELMEVIKELSNQGITVIMSLHELELALEISDRLILVKNDGTNSCMKPREVLDSKVLKQLYNLTDEMYEKIVKTIDVDKDDSEIKVRHSSYFCNDKCEYFPCHKLPKEKFSCLFCYCPLYDVEDCGGTYTYTDKGIKNCMDCTFPHERENYPKVIKKLKEKMYEKKV